MVALEKKVKESQQSCGYIVKSSIYYISLDKRKLWPICGSWWKAKGSFEVVVLALFIYTEFYSITTSNCWETSLKIQNVKLIVVLQEKSIIFILWAPWITVPNPPSYCWDISVWTKSVDRRTNIASPRAAFSLATKKQKLSTICKERQTQHANNWVTAQEARVENVTETEN